MENHRPTRLPGEDYFDYFVRLAEKKREYGLNWNDIANLLNQENGKDFVRTDKKVKIGAVVDSIDFGGVFGFYYGNDFTILTSSSGMEHFAPGLGYNCFTLWGNGELNDETDENGEPIYKDIHPVGDWEILGVVDNVIHSPKKDV